MSPRQFPLTRRTALTAAAVGAAGLAAAVPGAAWAGTSGRPAAAPAPAARTVQVADSWTHRPFDEAAVSLAPSLFTGNRDRFLVFGNGYPVDSILYNFRRNAGLDTKGAAAMGSWEEPNGNLRGHFSGHYLSMLAYAYAGSGGTQAWRARVDYAVGALKECQDALAAAGNSRPGFLAAYPETQFDQLEVFTTYPTIWAPYYTCHKIMAGLLDCYRLTGSAVALDVVTKMGDWVHARLSATTYEQRQRMWGMYIAGEYGGMNESMMQLHEIHGDAKYLTAAKFFDLDTLINACAANTDTLSGKHANQHIPQFLGYLKIYEATGEQRYFDAVKNFWEMVVPHRIYSHGGVGQGELFRARDAISGSINGTTNAETCAAYNMLKVSRALFFHTADAKYMNYYEKTLFNQILGSLSATTSTSQPQVTYMLPVGPGVTRGFGNFGTCCGGTGLENHVKYQDSIWFTDVANNALLVNLYIPSTVTWAAKNVTVTQTTTMPLQGQASLTVQGSGQFALKLRVPVWANQFSVTVNGTAQGLTATPGTYVSIDRTWATGDVVAIEMPVSLRVESALDDPQLQSVFNGPSLLVARSGQGQYRKLSLYAEQGLDGSLAGLLEPSGTEGLFTDGTGTTYAPLHIGTNQAYHMYFQRSETKVAFAGSDSKVANPARPDKRTLLDDIWSHAPFESSLALSRQVMDTTQEWVDEGRLSRRDRQAILLAAARARY